jgi:hypothetical protein
VILVKLRVRKQQKLFQALDRLTELVSDQRERGWQGNVDVRLDFERRYLDSEGAGGWAPLNDEYRLRKAEEVGNLPELQFSKRMYRSLTEEGAPNFIREEGADFLKVGSSDPKARYHHEGAGRLPVREVMRATDEEARAQLQVFHDSYEATSIALGFQVI